MAVSETIDQELLTGEQLARLGDIGPCELVEGRIVRTSPTGYLAHRRAAVHGGADAERRELLPGFALSLADLFRD